MIDIYGSKNLLDIMKSSELKSKINNTIISSSLQSQFATSIPLTSTRLNNLPEDYRKIIETDFRKSLRLNNNRGSILIADFLSERNNIAEYNNSKISLNTEVKSYVDNNHIQNVILESRVKSIPTLINSFIDIADNYDKVVICEFYLTNYFLEDNNILNLNPNQYGINKVNALLKTFYEHLKFQKDDYTYLNSIELYSAKNHHSRINPWEYSSFTKNNIMKIIENTLD